jgi:predicted ribosomally synthesized peptide with nif11-like leader
MSRDELHRLLEDAQRQPNLLSDLRVHLGDAAAAAHWAVEKGYDLDPEEIEELRESDTELSDEELDQAAGGDWAPGQGTPPPGGSGGGG